MIGIDEHDGVAVVRLEHGKVNALDLELLRAFTATMTRLSEASAIVLTGSGTVFSAGVDLRRVVNGGPAYGAEFLPALIDAFLAVFDHPRPVVAAINGHALAGGCVVAAACDVRLMAAGTLALTGRTMTAAEAQRIGLVDAVVDAGALMAEALRRAAALGRVPAAVYMMTKEQLHRPARQAIEAHQPIDDPRATAVWTSPEALTEMARYLDRLRRRAVD